MKKLSAVFFDHDGTLVDSEYTHYQDWKKLMMRYNIDFKLDTYIKYFTGVPGYQNAIDLVEMFDLRVSPQLLLNEKDKIEAEAMDKIKYPLMPFALETINFFKEKDTLLGVVSGAYHKCVEASIAKHNLIKVFEFIVGGDDVYASKPAPDVYLKAIEFTARPQGECVAIEDTSSGVKAARSAGLFCIAVKSKYSETQDFSEATVVVNNLREAKDWIVNNFSV